MNRRAETYLRKTIFWQRLMTITGGIALAVAITFGGFYVFLEERINEEEWIGIAIWGIILSWLSYAFLALHGSTRYLRTYVDTKEEADLLQAVDGQRKFWKSITLLIFAIALLLAGVFFFVLFLLSNYNR